VQHCKPASARQSVQGSRVRVAGRLNVQGSGLRAQGWSKAPIEKAEKAAAGERKIVEIDE
jgi:hypothetical protein